MIEQLEKKVQFLIDNDHMDILRHYGTLCINAQTSKLADINEQDFIYAIDTLLYAKEKTSILKRKPILDAISEYFMIKKFYNISNEEFTASLNNVKNTTDIQSGFKLLMRRKKEEKLSEMIEKGFDQEQLLYFQQFPPLFTDIALLKMEEKIILDEIKAANELEKGIIIRKDDLDDYEIISPEAHK